LAKGRHALKQMEEEQPQPKVQESRFCQDAENLDQSRGAKPLLLSLTSRSASLKQRAVGLAADRLVSKSAPNLRLGPNAGGRFAGSGYRAASLLKHDRTASAPCRARPFISSMR
jgi:hypothetical protein